MSILFRSEAVASYAAQVRAELAGLDPELLDDLTEGLEADLTEALVDTTPEGEDSATYLARVTDEETRTRFGSPAAYATELAHAAGVTPADGDAGRRSSSRRTPAAFLHDEAEVFRRYLASRSQDTRWGRETTAVLTALRPAWWLLRGAALAMIVNGLVGLESNGLVPVTFGGWVITLGLIIVSVWWGQGRFGQSAWQRTLGLFLGFAAALAGFIGLALIVNSYTPAGTTDDYNMGYSDAVAQLQSATGAIVDGEPASNLFVFGPDGEPIDGAQIVDQDGRPLVLANPESQTSWTDWESLSLTARMPLAALTPNGQLNAYPYSWIDATDVDWSTEPSPTVTGQSQPILPVWPVRAIAPIEEAWPATLPSAAEPNDQTPPTTGAPPSSESETSPDADDSPTDVVPDPDPATTPPSSPSATGP